MEFVTEIPGKLKVEFIPEAKAMLDTWSSYHITLEQFRDALLNQGVKYAKINGAVAWIADSSDAKGVLTQEIQDIITTEIFPTYVKTGIKYFITITSKSAVTKMTIKNYEAKTEASGLKLLTVASVDEALAWLKANHK